VAGCAGGHDCCSWAVVPGRGARASCLGALECRSCARCSGGMLRLAAAGAGRRGGQPVGLGQRHTGGVRWRSASGRYVCVARRRSARPCAGGPAGRGSRSRRRGAWAGVRRGFCGSAAGASACAGRRACLGAWCCRVACMACARPWQLAHVGADLGRRLMGRQPGRSTFCCALAGGGSCNPVPGCASHSARRSRRARPVAGGGHARARRAALCPGAFRACSRSQPERSCHTPTRSASPARRCSMAVWR